ncbi:MAG: hypothetical protein AB1896_07770 [Thermodesulfobacteriota bacterium]
MRKVAAAILVLSALLSAGRAGAEEKETSLAEISTKAGSLHLVERPEGRFFLFEGEVLHRGTRFMDVQRFFRPKGADFDALLIKDFTGPIHCPVTYFFLTFGSGRPPMKSQVFGHCRAFPEMSVKGGAITLEFGPFGSMPGETWVFDGKTLKKEEAPPPS